jgi:hypothetical protein
MVKHRSTTLERFCNIVRVVKSPKHLRKSKIWLAFVTLGGEPRKLGVIGEHPSLCRLQKICVGYNLALKRENIIYWRVKNG